MVVGSPVLVEIPVRHGDLVQGIGQVEGHFLLLRIQEDGQLVGRRDDIHHLLMLHLIVLVEQPLAFRALVADHLQFGAKVPEHVGQGLPVYDGQERDGKDKECKYEG